MNVLFLLLGLLIGGSIGVIIMSKRKSYSDRLITDIENELAICLLNGLRVLFSHNCIILYNVNPRTCEREIVKSAYKGKGIKHVAKTLAYLREEWTKADDVRKNLPNV